jgi:uncharacterized protein (DUF1499 family)
MFNAWEVLGLAVACVVAGAVLMLGLFRALSRRPTNLGARDGRLAPCPRKPNCVCSQSPPDAREHIEPLRLPCALDEAMRRAKAMLSNWPRARIIAATEDYVHAECRSWLFRFVDDVELVLDRDAGVIHCRSASRVGHSDLGVNRRRIEALRQALAVEPRPSL